jgi:hypothetical protein
MPNPIISPLKNSKNTRQAGNKKRPFLQRAFLKLSIDGNYPPIEIRLNSFTVSVFAASAKS